ncbi:hypothetical protein AVEN_238848-1 [Araneus ventricosus]|uniref:Uncharacterized protein n=1 Tax=Araneus ventricosus TaxID=182803 RepID=A0A4Y2EPK0_ARAVE|nr:hypothetical protein AVEN_238848-1 [Araneus ventricosus]
MFAAVTGTSSQVTSWRRVRVKVGRPHLVPPVTRLALSRHSRPHLHGGMELQERKRLRYVTGWLREKENNLQPTGIITNDNRLDVSAETEGEAHHRPRPQRRYIPSSEWRQLNPRPLLYPAGKREPTCLSGSFSSAFSWCPPVRGPTGITLF